MISQAFDAPWKVHNGLWRWLAYPRVRWLFARNGIPWGHGWHIFGVPVLQKHRHSRMSFGPGMGLRSSVQSNPLAPNHAVVLVTWQAKAELIVGANFAMTGGTLCAAKRITIGNNVALGANSTIVDTDFHPLDASSRRTDSSAGACRPVVIEDDVFIGMNCLILKGVRIGHDSVVGAGSVVTQDVPAGVVAAGNPAHVVRQLAPQRLSPALEQTA